MSGNSGRKVVVDDPLRFTISARLSDGSFESSVSVPITATPEFVKTTFEAWVCTLYAGIDAFVKGGKEQDAERGEERSQDALPDGAFPERGKPIPVPAQDVA